jgi:hypothetical protein
LLDASLVVVAVPAVIVAPEVPALPLIEKVGAVQVAVKFTPVTLLDVMVTELEAGLKEQPLLLGVTV